MGLGKWTGHEIGVLNGNVKPGDTIAIVGAGPIGLSALLTAGFYSPAKIYMIDLDENRLHVAKSFGANHTLNSGTEDVVKRIMAETKDGVDVAIEAVGAPATFDICQKIVRPGGHIAKIRVLKNITMKKDALKLGFSSIFLALTATLFIQCSMSTDHKAPAMELKIAVIDTTTTQSKPDTIVTVKAPPAPEPPKTNYSKFSLKSTKAVIIGTSSLHAWESKITQMDGKGTFEYKADKLIGIQNLEIKIPVKSIKSKEGKKMDNKTYDTFKADKNPYIIYTFKNAAVKVNASNKVTIEASGNLTMAGITQAIKLSASGKKLANGNLQLSVSKKLNMTDYKMEAPVMMLGAIKVGKEISLDFDFELDKTK